MFRVKLLSTAEQDLERLDKEIARLIVRRLKWFAGNYENLSPIPLKGEFKEFNKFRVGDHRVLYSVSTDEKLVIVHYVRYRSEAYKHK